MKKRQKLRKILIYSSFILFPITLNYFSPYLIVAAAAEGIINGSFVVFGLMFLASLFLGRAWCGWLCPGGGVMEMCFEINDKPAPGGKYNLIKWFGVWLPWIAVIVFLAIKAGGYHKLDFFFMSEKIVSVDEPSKFIIYFIVVFIFAGLSVWAGKRAGCRYICWMAPFMIAGTWLGRLLRLSTLRLSANARQCNSCLKCNRNCPMSLDVKSLTQKSSMYDPECILCGNCVDICPKGVIAYTREPQRPNPKRRRN